MVRTNSTPTDWGVNTSGPLSFTSFQNIYFIRDKGPRVREGDVVFDRLGPLGCELGFDTYVSDSG